jgi:hypothetical protein
MIRFWTNSSSLFKKEIVQFFELILLFSFGTIDRRAMSVKKKRPEERSRLCDTAGWYKLNLIFKYFQRRRN